ncbi:MAG: hypothetical protein ACI4US_00740 [Muribaculaceae bacterium]
MPLTANKNDNKDRAVPELGIPPVDKPEAEVPEVKPAQAAADEAPAAQPEAVPAARPAKKWAAVISFVITVLAWVALPFNEVATLVLGVAGLITSIIALRQPRGAWRNLTLVAIVAAAVLLLVLAIFWGGILFALGSL